MTLLFPEDWIPQAVKTKLPDGYQIRPLDSNDYNRGFLQVLAVLTTVGEISERRFQEQYEYIKRARDTYYLIVVENDQGRIVGCGTLLVERKFIHTCGLVGHIEDIAIAKSEQGKKLGLRIIDALDGIAKEIGCYKNTLACAEHNQIFYEKCGYKRNSLEMGHYFQGPPSPIRNARI
jgi:glucosamine-phosphate N-acetyltransferase